MPLHPADAAIFGSRNSEALAPIVAHVDAIARRFKWPWALRQRAMQAAAALPPEAWESGEALAPHMVGFFETNGRSLAEFEAVADILGYAIVGVPPPALPQSTAEEDTTRLAEIRTLSRQNSDAIDPWLEREQHAIIARQQERASLTEAASAKAVAPPSDGDVSKRLTEIRAIRRADPQGYDYNRALQAEERRLLEQMPSGVSLQSPEQVREAERAAVPGVPDADNGRGATAQTAET